MGGVWRLENWRRRVEVCRFLESEVWNLDFGKFCEDERMAKEMNNGSLKK